MASAVYENAVVEESPTVVRITEMGYDKFVASIENEGVHIRMIMC